jgi:hypothetical protein
MSITSADAIITLSQPLLFSTPQQLQGFAADDIFRYASIKAGEVKMGVDGILSAGFIFVEVPQTFMLQADSPSNAFFDTLFTQEQATKAKYPISGVVLLPSISTKWTSAKGFLTDYEPAPAAKKTLEPRSFVITWERIAPSPV